MTEWARTRAIFWSKVAVRGLDECWNWLGAHTPHGYANFSGSSIRRALGMTTRAHQVAFLLTRGYVDKTLHVLHSCDNPGCVNPMHLRQGSHSENMRDKVVRNRSRLNLRTGELHWASKLDSAKVRAIRLDNRTQRAIAADYGISQTLVGDIKLRKIWKEVV
jgi:hypothetical protein